MPRIRIWSLVVAATVVCVSACGGRTPPEGTAGAAGVVGAAGQGTGGGNAGGGNAGAAGIGGAAGSAGVSPWAACDGPGQCTIAEKGCCGVCGKPTLADVEGVNAGALAAFHDAECPEQVPCPLCPTAFEPNLVALCESGACQKHDLRTDASSACATDADCALRAGSSCCESCAAGSFELVAMAKSALAHFSEQICAPATGCPACVPAYPPGFLAVCGADHHCAVAASNACPETEPLAGMQCATPGQSCEYGGDPRPACRTHATCAAGVWSTAISGCPPLPGPGQSGCPTSTPAFGTCPNDGLVCDMAGGAFCACGACLGPCSTVPVWVCVTPPGGNGCPPLAPDLGAACAVEGVACTYGVCGTATSAGRVCTAGAWHEQGVACPL